MTPAVAMPATMREMNSDVKSVVNAPTRVLASRMTRLKRITRVLPMRSPSGPNTGCAATHGSANAVAKSAACCTSTPKSAAICGRTGSVMRDAEAAKKLLRQMTAKARVMPATSVRNAQARERARLALSSAIPFTGKAA
jgi:hypothetical protein